MCLIFHKHGSTGLLILVSLRSRLFSVLPGAFQPPDGQLSADRLPILVAFYLRENRNFHSQIVHTAAEDILRQISSIKGCGYVTLVRGINALRAWRVMSLARTVSNEMIIDFLAPAALRAMHEVIELPALKKSFFGSVWTDPILVHCTTSVASYSMSHWLTLAYAFV